MTKSIMQNEKKCWVTDVTEGLHCHHIYRAANRKLSEQYGCYIWLRPDWHNMSNYGIHFDKSFDNDMKQLCQRRFEETYPDLDFRQIFGKSFL